MHPSEDKELPKGSSPVIQFKEFRRETEERERLSNEASCSSCFGRSGSKKSNPKAEISFSSRIPNESSTSHLKLNNLLPQNSLSRTVASKSFGQLGKVENPKKTRKKPKFDCEMPNIRKPEDDFDIKPEPEDSAFGLNLLCYRHANLLLNKTIDGITSPKSTSIKIPWPERCQSSTSQYVAPKKSLSPNCKNSIRDFSYGLLRKNINNSAPLNIKGVSKSIPYSQKLDTIQDSEKSITETDSLGIDKKVPFQNKEEIKWVQKAHPSQISRVSQLLEEKRELAQKIFAIEEALRNEFENDPN